MKKYLPWLLLALALVLAGVIILCVNAAGADTLEERILGTWYRQGGENWYLEFAVEDGKMEYRFVSAEFSDLSETLYTYGCEVKNGSILRVQYPEGEKRVRVTFSRDGKEMTFSPAITSAEDEEVWVRP